MELGQEVRRGVKVATAIDSGVSSGELSGPGEQLQLGLLQPGSPESAVENLHRSRSTFEREKCWCHLVGSGTVDPARDGAKISTAS